MNMTTWLVVGAICCIVPLSLLAAFSVSRDQRSYVQHYDAEGFSVEACNRNARRVVNANGIMVAKPIKRRCRETLAEEALPMDASSLERRQSDNR